MPEQAYHAASAKRIQEYENHPGHKQFDKWKPEYAKTEADLTKTHELWDQFNQVHTGTGRYVTDVSAKVQAKAGGRNYLDKKDIKKLQEAIMEFSSDAVVGDYFGIGPKLREKFGKKLRKYLTDNLLGDKKTIYNRLKGNERVDFGEIEQVVTEVMENVRRQLLQSTYRDLTDEKNHVVAQEFATLLQHSMNPDSPELTQAVKTIGQRDSAQEVYENEIAPLDRLVAQKYQRAHRATPPPEE